MFSQKLMSWASNVSVLPNPLVHFQPLEVIITVVFDPESVKLGAFNGDSAYWTVTLFPRPNQYPGLYIRFQ
jgi:hypothetical protein